MSEAKINVKVGRRPAYTIVVNNPTTLGLILQDTGRNVEMQIVQGLEYAWVQQVIQNIQQGHRYQSELEAA